MNGQQQRARQRDASGFSLHHAMRTRHRRLHHMLEGLESRVLLSTAPAITAPMIFGVRPGSPFLFDVTASGDRPMTFSAVGLPAGLTLNPQTGMITGSLANDATYDLILTATNPSGSSQQNLRIVVGDKISLTPAMGWNSWTVDQGKPTDAEVRAQAAAIASSGLINYGWTYVNVDGGWEGGRTAEGAPLGGNATTFPDMQGLSDYIHSLNLKFGVYTVPQWIGYANEPAGTSGINIWPDAQQFGAWGVDYLKYDGGPVSPADIMQMNQALQATGRDIILSMSYFGGLQATPGNIAFYTKWSNSWRVGSDITDFYSLVLTDGISLEQPWATFSGPGQWNDPDSLMVGDIVGTGGKLHGTGLTFYQQQSAMSIWSMAAAPLLLGSDLTQLSPASMSILTNPEVIAIDQDPLGIQSLPVNGRTDIQSRPLADGSIAVEMVNYYDVPQPMTINFSDLGLSGPQVVRDLWANQDVATSSSSYTVTVPVGGTALIKLTPATAGAPKITFEPVNQNVNAGNSATFSILAAGGGVLNYQWLKNGIAISGANSATYTTPATTPSDDGAIFRCVVTNSVGRIISYEADLGVHGITRQLSDGFYYNGISSYVNNAIRFDANVEGSALTINGATYPKGIGTQANSEVDFWLDRNYSTFEATVGIDGNKPGSVDFQVWLDGTLAYSTGPVTGSMAGIPISLNVMGARTLKLVAVNTGAVAGNAQVNWANARLTTALVATSLPSISDISKTAPYNSAIGFSPADFTSVFVDPNAGQSLQNIQVASLPAHGVLKLNGAAVASGQIVPLAQTANLVYTPANGYVGSDTFAWNAADMIGYAAVAAAVNLAVLAPPPSSIPIAPIGVNATPGDGQTTLSWTAVAGAVTYTVRYGTTNGGPYPSILAGISGTNATIPGLVKGTSYYFVISAVNANGESPYSSQVTITLAPPVVGPPATSLDYSNGFANAASSLAINGSARISGGKLLLTDNNVSQASSVYAKAQQNITAFTTQFDFQIDGTWPLADGFTFVIQRSGLTAIGMGGGGLGYGAIPPSTTGGISNSVAIKFDVFDNQGEGNNSTGLFTNGAAPTSAGAIDLGGTGFNMRSYNPSRAVMTYDGTTLTVVLTDLLTHASATQTYTVDIPSLIGGTTAWVGFTAADGSIMSNQAISKWTYNSTTGASLPIVPATPTGLAAAAGTGQVVLNWNAVSGADSYTIKYGTTNGASYTSTVTGVVGTSKTITGLNAGTPYYFVVSAVNSGGESSNSVQAAATPSVPPPDAPTGVNVTPGNTQIALTWNAIAGATSYIIKYGTSSGSYSITLTSTATSATLSSLTNGTTYYVVVSAMGIGGEGVNSAESVATPVAPIIPVIPDAPTGLAVVPGNAQVVLTWNAVAGATGYNVKYGTSSGSYTTAVHVSSVTSTTIPLNNGTAYYFVVSAVNGVGEGNNSTQAIATPVLPAPAAPTGVTATAGDGGVVLNWNAAVGAATYTIKYGTVNGAAYTGMITGLVSTTGTITGLVNGTPYYFVITASNSGGESGNSAQASAIPAAPVVPGTGIDFSSGFAGAGSILAFNGSARIAGSDLELTDGSQSKAVSVYHTAQQNIAGFSTQFDYQVTGTWPLGDGFTFVIQRSGLDALGIGGGGLGYGADHTGGTGGISNSIAIKFDLYDNQGEGNNSTGLYVNGEAPTQPHAVWLGDTSFNMRSYDRSHAAITYDGTTLTVVLTDLVTSATVTQRYTIDIPATIGGNLAWIGFTAGTGYMTNVSHILNWNFTSTASLPPPVAPSAPTGLASASGNAQIGLTWNAVAGASSYTIKYATVSGGPYTVIPGVSGTSKSVTGLVNGTPYYFVVSAVNAVGEGASSLQISATPTAPVPPAAPAGVIATPGNAQIVLVWNAVPGAASYTIKYGTTSGSYTSTLTSITGTSSTLTGLSNGTTYYFVVSAVNGGGEGSNSLQVSATPILPAPPAPGAVIATAGNSQASLNWSAVPGATTYSIKYGTTNGGSYSTTITGITATNALFTNLTNGMAYYFVVTALNSAGESPNSSQATATPNSVVTTLDFTDGFANAGSALKINGSARVDAGRLLMTTNEASQVSSIYATTQQNITHFSTQFDFQINGSWPLGDGFTFVIQRAGLTAIGQSGSGLGYGASDTSAGIPNSVAIKFDVFSNQGEGTNSTGFYANGAAPTAANSIDLTGTGFDLRSYNRSHASVSYNGITLTVILTDLVTHATATQTYTVNIPALIGGNMAWVGFTAADGSIVSNQTILSWTYVA